MKPFDWQKWLVLLIILAAGISGTWYLVLQQPPMTTLSVPAQNLPAYYLITDSELMTITMPTAVLPATPLLQSSQLVGHYTSQPLTAKEVVTDAQLVPAMNEKLGLHTTAVAIPATAAMTYNGRLKSGTIVKVWAITDEKQATSLLEAVLVLDVQEQEVEGQSEIEGTTFPYVVILAVPEQKTEAVVTAVSQHILWLTIQQQ